MFHTLIKLILEKGERDKAPAYKEPEGNIEKIIDAIIGSRLMRIENLRKRRFCSAGIQKLSASVEPADWKTESVRTPSITRLSSQQALVIGTLANHYATLRIYGLGYRLAYQPSGNLFRLSHAPPLTVIPT
jgi:hypothetical protein